jgi:hypothetical protein
MTYRCNHFSDAPFCALFTVPGAGGSSGSFSRLNKSHELTSNNDALTEMVSKFFIKPGG